MIGVGGVCISRCLCVSVCRCLGVSVLCSSIFIGNRLTSIGYTTLLVGILNKWEWYVDMYIRITITHKANDTTALYNNNNTNHIVWRILSVGGFVHYRRVAAPVYCAYCAGDCNCKLVVKVDGSRRKLELIGWRWTGRFSPYVLTVQSQSRGRPHKYHLNGMNEWFICVHRLGHIWALIYAVTWQKRPTTNHLPVSSLSLSLCS